MKSGASEILRRVDYADTDAGGVVYYGRYLEFLESGRMEHMRQAGCDPVEKHNEGCFFAVREIQATYRSSARLGDLLRVRSCITEISRVTMTFESAIERIADNRLILESVVKCVCVDPSGRLLSLPEDLVEALKNYQGTN